MLLYLIIAYEKQIPKLKNTRQISETKTSFNISATH